jgi:hypothetical protein
MKRHRPSPIAQEPTKTLRGALALVTRRKLLHQIRGPSLEWVKLINNAYSIDFVNYNNSGSLSLPHRTALEGSTQLGVKHVTASSTS